MQYHRAIAAACSAVLLVYMAPSVDGQDTGEWKGGYPLPADVQEVMYDFLQNWLVEDDQQKAMRHFSASNLSVAPEAVWRASQKRLHGSRNETPAGQKSLTRAEQDAYWEILTRVRPPQLAVLPKVLEYIAPNLKMFLDSRELDVEIVHDNEFIVFVADRAVELDSFDGGYGNVSQLLQPSEERPTLTMIADFQHRAYEGYDGPFVAFWGEERLDRLQTPVWRILALGAVPDEMVWNDGR